MTIFPCFCVGNSILKFFKDFGYPLSTASNSVLYGNKEDEVLHKKFL